MSTFKSKTQPHCIQCGKPIAKHTENVYTPKVANMRPAGEPLRTKADCQKSTNLEVMGVRYQEFPEVGRFVFNFSTWDGESYVDEFFCNGDHAKRFAYRMARKGAR